MVGRSARVVGTVIVLAAFAIGCSDDDEKAKSEPKEFASCNEVADGQACTEIDGSAATIEEERGFCEGYGIWSTELCPTTDLLGCCAYKFEGDSYRDCYYTGYPATADELTYECDFDDGKWTTGGR
jgi:hypothetical protein